MSDVWYRPDAEANTPPLRARCRVVWGGRMFAAWRDTHPKTRRRCWAVELGDGIVDYWPPKQWPCSFRGMGEEPELFQPRHPESWPYPLPEPERASEAGRMYSTRGSGRGTGSARYGAMAAQAAQSAAAVAEIESALGFTLDDLRRERAADAAGDEERGHGSRWWKDSSLLTYSQPGEITRDEAEARILRAILTDGLRPWKQGERLRRAWPQELIDWAEAQKALAEDPRTDTRERFVPSPDDISDSLVAMKWFAALDPPQLRPGASDAHVASAPIRQDFTRDQVLLILRALEPPYTWRQIGRHELVGRVSHTQARRFYRDALERVWRAANGFKVFDHVTVRDELAALRERNRAFKREGV
ncbi:MAG: hypothetical protein JNN24_03310 [Hyphomicrobium zavarzinii]|uniref:hypothetical protein n=1 Tax=Hyphomicrobium zavarzinii TaxID=48292 RepID=UPI001A5FFE4D|nr:hypothetical protein [Hyphomicrobium zavarzinii]MBL8844778.1 hypothetical protein [Hyphomicrobium zavarzinii]